MANDVLGTCECIEKDCSETVSVMQARRKGAHLYTRCPECGLDQRTGKVVQRYYWVNTVWRAENPPTPPINVEPNLTENLTEPLTESLTEVTEPDSVKSSVKSTDFNPSEMEVPSVDVEQEQAKTEKETELATPEEKPVKKKGRAGLWLTITGLTAAVVATFGAMH